jgi:hypothetical protein
MISILGLTLAVAIVQNRYLYFVDAESLKESAAQVIGDAKSLRLIRQRTLQVQKSPLRTDVDLAETRTHEAIESDERSGYESLSLDDIDVWSRLLQSDSSMMMQTPVPTVSPNSPTDAPFNKECESLDRADAILTLIEDVSDSDSIADAESPQGMAFDWISNVDTSSDPCDDPELVVTRYALATFFESTAGDNWTESTNWLSIESECNWYGISCDDNGHIDAFELGKFFVRYNKTVV